MKCKSCGEHASRIRFCTTCRKCTCVSCIIEGICPDCWVLRNAYALESKETEYFDGLMKGLRYELKT